MTRRVGWYVHHHGRGHVTRLLAIAPHVDAEITCLSSLPAPEGLPAHCTWTVLARDDDPVDGSPAAERAPTADGILHWAPVGHPGHRSRLAAIAAHVTTMPVDAFVVDVSAEVTLLVRLLGVPPVVVTQPGIRGDLPHTLAFRAASAIVAPWPGELLRPDHLAPFGDRTTFTGGISRFAGRPAARRDDREGVLVLGGAGGSTTTDEDIAAARAATATSWRRIGGAEWVADPWEHLGAAEIVVSEAGQNAIADLAAAEARAIAVPQERPFAEQRATAEALALAGLAAVSPRWPPADAWPDLLERARGLDPDWKRWQVDGAAERAAAVIERVAAR